MRAWQERLAGDGLKIGLVWGGNPKHPREHLRTIPLTELARLTTVAGTHFYSLQKGPASAQIRSLPPGVVLTDLAGWLTDFAETAAAIANLDLIITSDTSVAHMAGALAKPVWILLHNMADWRWLLDREDSPWYPTARLFRKSPAEGWSAVVGRIREEVERLAGR
jgi:ADP-heptose:LPS heptosyltransferase